MKARVLDISSDGNQYFVYEHPSREKLYKGSYTKCLIVAGGVALNHSLEDSINLADSIKSS